MASSRETSRPWSAETWGEGRGGTVYPGIREACLCPSSCTVSLGRRSHLYPVNGSWSDEGGWGINLRGRQRQTARGRGEREGERVTVAGLCSGGCRVKRLCKDWGLLMELTQHHRKKCKKLLELIIIWLMCCKLFVKFDSQAMQSWRTCLVSWTLIYVISDTQCQE